MAGSLKLPLNGRQYFVVNGGPYRERPANMRGVKMAVEIDAPCDVDIPTVDFQIPDRLVFYRGLHKAVDLILAGEPLYIGCMGGVGRTGFTLAVLAKAFGVKKPVEYVRKHFNGHAVETDKQMKFVRQLTITPSIKRQIRRARRRLWWRFWKTNLTRTPQVPKPVPGKALLDTHDKEALRQMKLDAGGKPESQFLKNGQSRVAGEAPQD